VHIDLCELAPGCYFSTMIDEATRFARVGILHRKSDTAAEVRTQVVWCETQTGKRVQRVRHDRGGEYMSGQLQLFFAERGIQQEPTAGYTPEANGLAERHILTLLDIALPMLADSGDPQRGLPPLGSEYAGAAVIYANDLHNAGTKCTCRPHAARRISALYRWTQCIPQVWLSCVGAQPRSPSKVSA
jgi:transposase InsO family protein